MSDEHGQSARATQQSPLPVRSDSVVAVRGGRPTPALSGVRTIARTFPAYAAICALLGVVFMLQIAAFLLVGGAFSLGSGTSGASLQVVGAVITTYGWVVTRRIIGLYYRHYKSRFPWRAE